MTKAAAADSWTLDEWADGSDVSVPAPSVVFPGASWATDTPANQGLDGTATTAFISAISSGASGDDGGLFIRNGYQVASWGTVSTNVSMASATKPVTASMMFFAQEDALIGSPNDLFSAHGRSMISKDASMTLAHAASMKSGYTLVEEPGQACAYNDYGVMLLAKTIYDEIFGASGTSVLTSYLSALGFEDSPTIGVDYDLVISQRDFARIGHLWNQLGRWSASQVIPRDYFREWFRPLVPGTLPRTSGNSEAAGDYLGTGTFGGTANSGVPIVGVYGFGMWYNSLLNGTTRLFPSAPPNFRLAEGNSNKFLVMWPDEQIVVAGKSSNWGDLTAGAGVASSTIDNMMALVAATVP